MVCEHLRDLDDALESTGIKVVYRDRQPWTKNCRSWTRYACVFDLAAVRDRFKLADCVVDWEIDDHWQGSERGFVCNKHHDAIIGDFYPRKEPAPSRRFADWALPVIGCVCAIAALAFAIVMRVLR